jgi:hypothetical protein
MNSHSKRLWPAVLVALAVSGACGGGSGGGSATTKSAWTKAHGQTVSTFSIDIDVANQALDAGQRPDVLAGCNQLNEDLPNVRKALPVPDPSSDATLRSALDAVTPAVADCLQAARVGNDARLTEQAQREIKDGRTKMDAANKAIADWQ